MSFSEKIGKRLEFGKEMREILLKQSDKEFKKTGVKIGLYWLAVIVLHYLYNEFRYNQHKKRLYSQSSYDNPYALFSPQWSYDDSYLVVIIAVIITILLCIFNRQVRKVYLWDLAQTLLIIYTIWNLITIIAYAIFKIFCFIFRLSDKIEKKYKSLDDRQKNIVKRVVFTAVGFAAGYAINEFTNTAGTSTAGDSTFVNPHEVSGYTRADGTNVSGYFRDGDGNPLTNLTKEQGGGYFRKK